VIIKSRAAKLTEVVPGAPTRCPNCHHRVGTHFQAFYSGDPELPDTVRLEGWRCTRCGTVHDIPPKEV
jgi:DNA-directed RNA polymerase subunit RPC12/RpoP